MVRSMATQVNRSFDGILKTLIALTSTPWTIDIMQAVGELPARIWTMRGGKARSAARLPCMSVRFTHPSSTAGSAKLALIWHSSPSRLSICRALWNRFSITRRGNGLTLQVCSMAFCKYGLVSSSIRFPVSTRKSMISFIGTPSIGGNSERGAANAFRSISGVTKSTPRSRERCFTASPVTVLPRMKKVTGIGFWAVS